MKKRGEITAFYVETLLMIVVMIGILLVLTQVFGLAKKESVRAKRLTEAVTIAQNAAEILSARENLAGAGELLGAENWSEAKSAGGAAEDGAESAGEEEENSGAKTSGEAGAGLLPEHYEGLIRWGSDGGAGKSTAVYRIAVTRTWQSESLAEDVIEVFSAEGEEPVYQLTARQFRPGKEAA